MNLYLLTQNSNRGYDTYDGAVVAAEDETQARETHVGGLDAWVDPKDVKVELIGRAIKGSSAGIILASFNAG